MVSDREVQMNTGTVWSKNDTGKGFTFRDMMRRIEDIKLKSVVPVFDKIICSYDVYGVLEKLVEHDKGPIFSYTGVKLMKSDLLPKEVKAIFVNGSGSGMEIVAMWIGDSIKFVES